MKDDLLVRKYTNNGKIEIRHDDMGYFVRLINEVRRNKEIVDVSVDFRVDSMYEIINEELDNIVSSQPSMYYSFSSKPKYIKLPLRFDEDGVYLKTNIKSKQMTKKEIEEELGYKIDIIE